MITENILDKAEIFANAKSKWNSKNIANKIKVGNKYQRFLGRLKIPINDWSNCFDDLTKPQQTIIIKGELIRKYDSLPNSDKTKIMRNFGLSVFSSKWYKLPSNDKKILLNHIIR